MKRHPPLSVEYIRARLSVDVRTGACFWIDPTKYHLNLIGKEAGFIRTTKNKSYWMIKINGLPYYRSHIIYAIKHGEWPKGCLDHRNGDSLDDSWRNLRTATRLQNSQNRKVGKAGRLLPMGVRSVGTKYQARLTVEKVMKHLGCFLSISEAVAAYKKARKFHFGDWA